MQHTIQILRTVSIPGSSLDRPTDNLAVNRGTGRIV